MLLVLAIAAFAHIAQLFELTCRSYKNNLTKLKGQNLLLSSLALYLLSHAGEALRKRIAARF